MRAVVISIIAVALSNDRIERLIDEEVTFRYTEAATGRTKHYTLPVDTFIQRFLQHVLPKGFMNVRYYGLFRVGNRAVLAQARARLAPQHQHLIRAVHNPMAQPSGCA